MSQCVIAARKLNMKRTTTVNLLAVIVISVSALSARAGQIAADALPLPNRVALAELVIIGKVSSIEEKAVSALPQAGATNKVDYRIAVVDVGDALIAPKGTKTVKLGFVPPPPNVFISPPPFQATAGMEGAYFLSKHFDSDFYVASGQLDFLEKSSPNYEKNVALIKRCVKLLEDPNASLKAKENEDRFLTAGMVLARYRTRKSPKAEETQIDADESKLILQALADADWAPSADPMQLTPQMVLMRLPLTEKDGWTPPKDPKELPAYAQKWTKDHADTYRISKFVEKK
jgi:hypothetical protein